jgi:hypothetical protein
MDKIDSQILRLNSPDKNIRYDACEELRKAANLPREAIAALVQASHDPDPGVADAARRALLAHRQHEAQANSPPARFLCERCDRIVGEEILTCPDRPEGRCPYLVTDLMPLESRLKSAGGLLFTILLLLVFLHFADQSLLLLGSLFFCLMFIGTLWGTFGTSTLLYNPTSRLKWKRTAFLGITLQRTVIPACETLPTDPSFSESLLSPPGVKKFSDPESLLFPPSVTKFSEAALIKWTMSHAIAVFRAALIGLLTRQVIQIHEYPKYVAGWGEHFRRDQSVYVLTASEEPDLASIDGELERQIVLVLRSWVKRHGREVLEWPDGPPIYEVVRAVFKPDVSSPERWIFDLVARDAIAHGWWQIPSGSQNREQLNAAQSEQLQSEITTFNRLAY